MSLAVVATLTVVVFDNPIQLPRGRVRGGWGIIGDAMSTSEVEILNRGAALAFGDVARAFASPAFVSCLRDFGRAAHELYEAARANYRAAGAPYGDTDEGMMLWLEDGAALLRARPDGPLASSGTGKTDAEV